MSVRLPWSTARALCACAASLALFTSDAESQDNISWQEGPVVGRLGSIAEIRIPHGYSFAGAAGARTFLELTENPPSGEELGVLIPHLQENEDFWFIIFDFTESGYVRDDERDELDADAILRTIRRGNEEGNRIRRERGWSEVNLIGWSEQPFYDAATNNLTWATLGESDGQQGVNYSTRLLGRHGTMNVDLVLAPGQLQTVVPEFEQLLQGFSFLEGNRYADWREGDKVAAYGLTALVAGGAGAIAMKSGVLQKLGKFIVLAVLAVLATLKKAVGSIFGRKKDDDGVQTQSA